MRNVGREASPQLVQMIFDTVTSRNQHPGRGPSWIGDTVLAQPLFKLLHARHGALALDVLAPAWTFLSSAHARGAARDRESRRPRRAAAGAAAANRRASSRAKTTTSAIVLPNSFKSALVPWLAGMPRRTGYLGEMRWGVLNDARRVDEEALPQIAQRYAALSLSREAGAAKRCPTRCPAQVARGRDRRRATLARLGLAADRPAAALCPGAEYGPAKRWPASYFADARAAAPSAGLRGVARRLRQRRGDRRGDRAARAGRSAGSLRADHARQAIDVLASARLVVSNDSGLMHVAAALGRRSSRCTARAARPSPRRSSPDARILKLDLPCSPCFERDMPARPLQVHGAISRRIASLRRRSLGPASCRARYGKKPGTALEFPGQPTARRRLRVPESRYQEDAIRNAAGRRGGVLRGIHETRSRKHDGGVGGRRRGVLRSSAAARA